MADLAKLKVKSYPINGKQYDLLNSNHLANFSMTNSLRMSVERMYDALSSDRSQYGGLAKMNVIFDCLGVWS